MADIKTIYGNSISHPITTNELIIEKSNNVSNLTRTLSITPVEGMCYLLIPASEQYSKLSYNSETLTESKFIYTYNNVDDVYESTVISAGEACIIKYENFLGGLNFSHILTLNMSKWNDYIEHYTITEDDLDAFTYTGIYGVNIDTSNASDYHCPSFPYLDAEWTSGSLIVIENDTGCNQIFINNGRENISLETTNNMPAIAVRTINSSEYATSYGSWKIIGNNNYKYSVFKFSENINHLGTGYSFPDDYCNLNELFIIIDDETSSGTRLSFFVNDEVKYGFNKPIKPNIPYLARITKYAITGADGEDGTIEIIGSINTNDEEQNLQLTYPTIIDGKCLPFKIGTWINGSTIWRLPISIKLSNDFAPNNSIMLVNDFLNIGMNKSEMYIIGQNLCYNYSDEGPCTDYTYNISLNIDAASSTDTETEYSYSLKNQSTYTFNQNGYITGYFDIVCNKDLATALDGKINNIVL